VKRRVLCRDPPYGDEGGLPDVSVEMEARDDDRPGSPRDCRLRLRRRVPGPCAAGPPANVSDAELVALAVCQAAMGISSDRQFLGLVERVLPGWFPHLPD
jgi:hypothetical protein